MEKTAPPQISGKAPELTGSVAVIQKKEWFFVVYILLGAGFEEIEAVATGDILRRGGVPVCYAAAGGNIKVRGTHDIEVTADALVSSVSPGEGDYIVVPGGMGGVKSISADNDTADMIRKAHESGCKLSAICAGPSVLAGLGLLEGKKITCYPGCEQLMAGAVCDVTKAVLQDGTLLTGRSPGAAIDFALSLLKLVAGEETALGVWRDLVY